MSTGNLLQRLPPELVARVFEYVGPDFFQHDVRRVAISRQWYDFARPVLLSHLYFSTSLLGRVLRALGKEEILAATQTFTKSFDIYLAPLEEEGSAGATLEELGSRLQRLTQLHMLSIQPGATPISLGPQTWRNFLSLGHLTSLTIDLANVDWTPTEQNSYHMCEAIGALLPSLKQLRCRLPYIVRSLARRYYYHSVSFCKKKRAIRADITDRKYLISVSGF